MKRRQDVKGIKLDAKSIAYYSPPGVTLSASPPWQWWPTESKPNNAANDRFGPILTVAVASVADEKAGFAYNGRKWILKPNINPSEIEIQDNSLVYGGNKRVQWQIRQSADLHLWPLLIRSTYKTKIMDTTGLIGDLAQLVAAYLPADAIDRQTAEALMKSVLYIDPKILEQMGRMQAANLDELTDPAVKKLRYPSCVQDILFFHNDHNIALTIIFRSIIDNRLGMLVKSWGHDPQLFVMGPTAKVSPEDWIFCNMPSSARHPCLAHLHKVGFFS
jgi:hypothetical protein